MTTFKTLIFGIAAGVLALASVQANADHRDHDRHGHKHFHGNRICHIQHPPVYLPPHYRSWQQYYRLNGYYPPRPAYRAFRHYHRHHDYPHHRRHHHRHGGWSVTFGERY